MIRAVILVVALAATGCAIDAKSGDFACTKQSDCTGVRICEDGFCIDPTAADARVPDARPGVPDAKEDDCPEECTSCDVGALTCTIDCMMTDCGPEVVCPDGYDCDILCNVGNSCRNGIDCNGADSCTILCSGSGACRDVQCGQGACDITCSGFQSCRNVDCFSSCACDVACSGTQSCNDAVFCPFGCDFGLGCTSLGPTCNTCN